MQQFTAEQKVGQLFFIGIPGSELDKQTVELLREVNPGGVCLFARNIKSPAQTRELLEGVRSVLPFEPFLSIDQEGGLVDRLRRIMTPMPPANKFRNGSDVREFASIIGEGLRILGFNMNFAPVVDVVDESRESSNNGLFSRAFGRSGDDVVELGGAFLKELQAGGIAGCLKHFPGLGASQVDSHEELPFVNITGDELDATDLAPYKALIGSHNAHTVMIAHAAYPQLDLQESDQNGRLLPSSLSRKIATNLLREELGFDGVAITDDLEMGAIVKNYGIGEACKMAVAAGNDMLAICAKPEAIREGFDAVSVAARDSIISDSRIDESLVRIEHLRSKLSPPLSFDSKRLNELSISIAKLNDRLN